MPTRPLAYFLDKEGNPVPTLDPMDPRINALFRSIEDRRVALTTLNSWEISTVFLVFDHAFDEGPPLLWETIVFWFGSEEDTNRPWEDYLARYASRAEAIQGHVKILLAIAGGGTPEDLE